MWVLGFAVIRVAVVPAEVCPEVTADEVHEAAVASADWLVRLRDDPAERIRAEVNGGINRTFRTTAGQAMAAKQLLREVGHERTAKAAPSEPTS